MAKCACLLRITGDTKTDTVNGKIVFFPPFSFEDPDGVPVAYEIGLKFMHILSRLPDEEFKSELERLLFLYPLPRRSIVKHTKRS